MTATDPVPDELPDPHTTAGKIADLERRRYEAVHAGSAAAVEKQHAKGKLTARERIGLLLDEGSFTEFDELARHRAHDFGIEGNRPYGDGVITGTGTVDGRPVAVYSPGLHRVRRVARRGLRGEDRQGHGPRHEGRLPGRRDQRRRRRPDPGGRRRPRPVRGDLLPQHPRLRRHPADQPDHGPGGRRRGLLPRDHRLHADGRGHQPHVHHRPRRDQDRHRRGRDLRGTRRRAHPHGQVRRRPLPGGRRGRTASSSPSCCCPTCRPTTSTSRPPTR